MSRFGRRTKWVLFLGSSLLAILCAEVVLRFIWHNPFRNDQPDRVVKLRMQHANTHHPLDRSLVHPENPTTNLRTNERSYILPSDQYDDPDCTIAFLGGSTTECFAVAEAIRFPSHVSTLLAEHGLKVSTLNAGTSGNTVHDSINILLNHVVVDRPDYVVMMHACNDIGVLQRTGDYQSRQAHYYGWLSVGRVTLMQLTNHSYTLALLRQTLRERTYLVPEEPEEIAPASDVDESLVANEPQFEQRLRVFIRTCRAMEIKPVIMTQPIRKQFNELTPNWVNATAQQRFNEIIRRVAVEEQACLVDLVEYVAREYPNPEKQAGLFYDGLHVNDQGSLAYAECITQSLLPYIQGYQGELSDELADELPELPDVGPLAELPTLRR